MARRFNEVDFIIAHEQGTLSDKDTLRLYSHLIKTGRAWQLQGHYGRTAHSLIEAGWLNRHGKIMRDLP